MQECLYRTNWRTYACQPRRRRLERGRYYNEINFDRWSTSSLKQKIPTKRFGINMYNYFFQYKRIHRKRIESRWRRMFVCTYACTYTRLRFISLFIFHFFCIRIGIRRYRERITSSVIIDSDTIYRRVRVFRKMEYMYGRLGSRCPVNWSPEQLCARL